MADDPIDVRMRLRDARRYNADAKSVARSTRDIGDAGGHAAVGADRATRSTGRYRRGLVLLGTASLGAAAIVGGVLVVAAKGAVAAFQESEEVQAQTVSALHSTRHAANVTARDVGNLATSISTKSGIDDEAIQSGENLLLTFIRIRNEVGKGNAIFDRASMAATNLSVRFNKDLQSSTIMVGKALNDPVKGITALSKAGVQFTDQQKDQIKTLVASGDTLSAQKIILRELNNETGGAAVAKGNTLTGTVNKARVAIGNLGEEIGGRLAPYLKRGFSTAARFVNQMIAGTGAGGQFVVIAEQIGRDLLGIVGAGRATVAVVMSIVHGFQEGKTWAVLLVLGLAALTAGFVTYRTAMMISAAATALMTGAQTALNLAMSLNPIGLIIAALVALGVAVFLAYKKSATFRHIVDAVWASMKVAAAWVKQAAIDAFPALSKAVGIAWTIIKHTPLAFVISHLGQIIGFVRGMPGKISAAASGMWNGVKTAFKSVINWIIGKWNGLHLKIPAVNTHIPGIGKVGGVTIGLNHIPPLAMGGSITRGGAALVGERGPEILDVPNPASVQPLTVPGGGGGGGLQDAIRQLSQAARDLASGEAGDVYMDGYKVGQRVARHVGREQAAQ